MFGLGPAEIVLVLVIALIVFGPRRLPEIGQALGKSIREFRDASSEITREFSREIEATERAARLEEPSDKRAKVAEEQEKPADESE